MTDQPALLLETTCRDCGASLPYSGVGRPRSLCPDCRPDWYPPVKELPRAAERYVTVREHKRRVVGDSSPIPRHRVTDGPTPRRAARKVAGQGVEAEILEVFARHPAGLTDDEVCACLPNRYPPTVKSARSRLWRNGYLIDLGIVRPSSRGADMAVWTLRNT